MEWERKRGFFELYYRLFRGTIFKGANFYAKQWRSGLKHSVKCGYNEFRRSSTNERLCLSIVLWWWCHLSERFLSFMAFVQSSKECSCVCVHWCGSNLFLFPVRQPSPMRCAPLYKKYTMFNANYELEKLKQCKIFNIGLVQEELDFWA